MNDINNIVFKYYFKDYKKCPGKVQKCCVKYLQLISVLELYNTKDSRGNLYNNGYTYQLMNLQDTLLKTKDLNIFKCNVYVDGQIIL
tara:strand:+ start:530 stop:790 length:261 start_codon:yes stop_codon:yes gene_type:complete